MIESHLQRHIHNIMGVSCGEDIVTIGVVPQQVHGQLATTENKYVFGYVQGVPKKIKNKSFCLISRQPGIGFFLGHPVYLQGVPENLAHFVFGILCFIYSNYGPTTPFI